MNDLNNFAQGIKKSFGSIMYADRRLISLKLKKILSLKADDPKLSSLCEDLSLQCAEAYEKVVARRASIPKLDYPEDLPVSQRHDEIVKAIKENQVVIICGETGSGKTTQIPKMCLEAGCGIRGLIGHTQPRRLAARAVAERIAEEVGESLGQSVGFKVRFSDITSPSSLIKLMTDGILLSETASDRLLLNYDCIIIDEAHERSLNIDFLLGYLKTVLSKRPELKLIITSATIDPESFSRHFDNAPIIEVSGRTFPVEVVYMPPSLPNEDDEDEEFAQDLHQMVLKAFKYLMHEHGPGDVLVFLPGEREIMDLMGFLNKSHLKGVEVLPLFARLASSEQHRIFTPHGGIRIILATNVAETSLTVPGIRYVIDPGTARLLRYSPRTKVQSLPIEKISKASANQRQGRCGRIGPGVCVRLYSKADFNARADFTDPEILRSNLAAVILQMVALRLGDVQSFPFIDPPQLKQITDGMRLLEELGAFENVRGQSTANLQLTDIGRKLANLPVDPRLGRMILQGAKLGALKEVLIIVAALAVMDPRESPWDKKEASRQAHARFNDEKSDFLSFLKLYQHIVKLQSEVSSSQWRRTLKKEFISYLRVREWFDVLRQLRASCTTLKLQLNEQEADYESIHRSLLSGLLSQIGRFDDNDKGLYAGARGIKFVIHPSSNLAKRKPKWVMCGELSETTRLFARNVAQIDPLWVEGQASHLIKKSYAEPHWSKKQGACVASLTITLYGLPIVSGRQTLYTTIDPILCHKLFIRDGLVNGDIDCKFPFYKHNQELISEVLDLEDKLRRRDILVDDSVLEAFYAERIPESVVTVRHFDKWWRTKSKDDPHYLDFKLEMLKKDDKLEDEHYLYPEYWEQGDLKLKLSYVFDPKSKDDGVTVHIPLAFLNQVKPREFVWQIPSLRDEFFAALIKSLPKSLRRNLIPAPNYAKALREALGDDVRGDLYTLACQRLTRMGGEIIESSDFDLSSIPQHLFMNFAIEDAQGKVIASGKSFDALASKLQSKAHEVLQKTVKSHKTLAPSTVWTFGVIKPQVQSRHGSMEVTVYPALCDHQNGVTLELCATKEAAHRMMWLGQRRLLTLSCAQNVGYLEQHLPNKAKLSMYYQPLGSIKELLEDLRLAAVDKLMVEHHAPCFDETSFNRLRDEVRGQLNETALELGKLIGQILELAHELKRRLKDRISLAVSICYADVENQLKSLIKKGFIAGTPLEYLKEYPRYLKAALMRLDKVMRDPISDKGRQRILDDVSELYKNALSRYKNQEVPADLEKVRWLIEELRVSFFAQQLGVKGPVSDRRIENEIARILKEWPPHN